MWRPALTASTGSTTPA